MSDFGEAVGTAVEGGLFAKAVAGEKSGVALNKGHFAEGACLNCGTPLTGNHCHECGQKAHLHRTIGAFMHDLLHGALHLEGRTWKTLPKLAFKPGELTRRYIDGERARFVSPMALFLFSIFLMFAAFQLAGISTPTDLGGEVSRDDIEETLDDTQARLESSRDSLQERIESADDPGELARQMEEAENGLAALAEVRSTILKRKSGSGGFTVTGPTDWQFMEQLNEKWRDNPGLMLYKLQTNFYKFSWLLIPISIPFVWLIFAWKRRFKAYDHAIFVTYSLSFMTLLILVVTLAGLAGLHAALITFALLLIPPIHIYKQLRGTYGLSRFSAFWRLNVLSFFIIVILALFMQALLLIGAF